MLIYRVWYNVSNGMLSHRRTIIAAEHYMAYADRSLSMPCHALVIYQLALNEALTVAVEAVLIIRSTWVYIT